MNMKPFPAYLFCACVFAQLLTGCSSTDVVRAVQHGSMAPYADIKLPSQAPGTARIFIYRPQAIVGSRGSAIVIVDGKWMGNPANPIQENHLLPGSVFAVDSAAKLARVWWYQPGRGEEKDQVIEVSADRASRWYLRWDLKPTHGYLQPVDESTALKEIQGLRFSAYVNLAEQ